MEPPRPSTISINVPRVAIAVHRLWKARYGTDLTKVLRNDLVVRRLEDELDLVLVDVLNELYGIDSEVAEYISAGLPE